MYHHPFFNQWTITTVSTTSSLFPIRPTAATCTPQLEHLTPTRFTPSHRSFYQDGGQVRASFSLVSVRFQDGGQLPLFQDVFQPGGHERAFAASLDGAGAPLARVAAAARAKAMVERWTILSVRVCLRRGGGRLDGRWRMRRKMGCYEEDGLLWGRWIVMRMRNILR
jgi:hypothetical protein